MDGSAVVSYYGGFKIPKLRSSENDSLTTVFTESTIGLESAIDGLDSKRLYNFATSLKGRTSLAYFRTLHEFHIFQIVLSDDPTYVYIYFGVTLGLLLIACLVIICMA